MVLQFSKSEVQNKLHQNKTNVWWSFLEALRENQFPYCGLLAEFSTLTF